MATFPIYREELAKLLGVTLQWCEDLHYGMPCARRVDGTAWWLSDEAQLSVWKSYADVWNNPPEPQPVRPVARVPEKAAWEYLEISAEGQRD